MFKLLVTGSRNPPTLLMSERVKYGVALAGYSLCPEGGLLIEGGSPGVDMTAKHCWVQLGNKFTCKTFPYPSEMGESGGPIRNQQMVDFGADLCLAFPDVWSREIYDCTRRAEKASIPTFIIRSLADIDDFERWVIPQSRENAGV